MSCFSSPCSSMLWGFFLLITKLVEKCHKLCGPVKMRGDDKSLHITTKPYREEQMNKGTEQTQIKQQRGKAYNQPVEQRIFRLPQIMTMFGLSRASIYRRMKDGQFPPNVSLGGGQARGWRKEDIDAWIADLEV